jgi:hypothetical protein
MAVFVLINLFSFSHYRKFDTTRSGQFTLPASVKEELKTLSPDRPTTVVVLQMNKTFGGPDLPEAIDKAAEKKVVEKIQDLVGQFRELGPQFKVVVLETQDERYAEKLSALTAGKPELQAAIESAPENSIFFSDEGKSVRRLGFDEFYRLDRKASQKTVDVDGVKRTITNNLVLIPQGLETFAKRAAQNDRKPRIALATIHPLLTTRKQREEYTASGLRKSLEAHGFEVSDVILKDWSRRTGPAPASVSYEETELIDAEMRYNRANFLAADRELGIRKIGEVRAAAAKATVDDLNKMFRLPAGQKFTTEAQKQELLAVLDANLEELKQDLARQLKNKDEFGPKYRELLADEKTVEARRNTDVKAKFAAAVAEADLLIVPRYTVMDVTQGDVIPQRVYNLAREQTEVIREFLKAGKPVLALFGPSNVNPGGAPDLGEGDELEQLFAKLGIEFGNQTLVYDTEADLADQRQGQGFNLSDEAKRPPLVFDYTIPDGKKPNPIAHAVAVAARAAKGGFELNKSGFRPIFVNPKIAAKLPYSGAIAMTTKDVWNEEKPLPEEEYIPKYEPTKPEDPKKRTNDEERRGPFPVGAALEAKLPAAWYDARFDSASDYANAIQSLGGAAAGTTVIDAQSDRVSRPSVRVAALGHGGLFVGRSLSPAAESLLVSTLNWQLGRDDRLARDVPDDEKWRFPRANLTPQTANLWKLIGVPGLPLACVYLGFVFLLVRRLR